MSYTHFVFRLLLNRREWLRVGLGGLGVAGPSVSRTLGFEPRPAAGFGRARSVILVYASGGQSQLDIWDPKPNAPLDVRGEFSPIATPLAGVQLCEHLPRVARLADRYTLIRSMAHEDLDHGSATYLALTGRYHARRSSNPAPSPTDFPSYGAVLTKVRRSQRFLYESVHINAPALVPTKIAPGQDAGFLGHECEPLVLGDVSRGPIAVPGLATDDPVPPLRLSARHSLKRALDQYHRKLASSAAAGKTSMLYQQALKMLSASRFRTAFDVSSEPLRLRNRYGRHRSGQACLLARRLVEAGVPLITVIWNHSNRGQDFAPQSTEEYGWDTHNDIFSALKLHLLPRFDQSFSALLEDLDERGLLDDTLVVCMGEFGRAPRVAREESFAGSSPGRKHWAAVYSIVVAGAGVNRGAVLGASDRLGAEPATERYGPWDMAATMFSALGIDPTTHFQDSLQRPFQLTVGQPIEAIYT